MDRPRVTVVVVNYEAGDRLARCFDRLAAQTADVFDVVLVDNGSADGSTAAALERARPFDVEVVDPGGNVGFAAANNIAARRARGDFLALLNPDAYPEPDWLEQLLAVADRRPDVDAFGSLQIDAADPARLDGAGDVMHASGVYYRGGFGAPRASAPASGEVFAPCAAAALWRRETFLRLGGFDEAYFCYGEDVDLAYRLRLVGGRCLQANEARVLHEGSGLTGRRSEFSVRLGARNRIRGFIKNTPAPYFQLLAPLHAAANVFFLVRAVPLGVAGAYFAGCLEAVRSLGEALSARRETQRLRTAPARDIARAMTWSPLALLRRAPDVRPSPPPRSAPRAVRRETTHPPESPPRSSRPPQP